MSKRPLDRLPEYILTIVVIITVNFLLPRLMPGDPFLYLSSDEGEVMIFSEEQRQYYLDYYGLNQPIGQQYLDYLSELIQGNLGYSLYYNEPVATIVWHRFTWTFGLVLASVILSTLLGTILGSISAWYRDKWVDKTLYAFLIILAEIPSFLLGLILLFVLAAGMGLFPLSGAMTHFAAYSGKWQQVWDIVHHAFLPVLALSIAHLGGMYLLARNSVTTVMEKDYVFTARAKGLSQKRVLLKHILRNAMLPIVTRVFLSLGSLVGGAILVENVFAYPGLGYLMREAVMVRDYALIQGIFLVLCLCVLLANFLADSVYARIDPRIAGTSTGEVAGCQE